MSVHSLSNGLDEQHETRKLFRIYEELYMWIDFIVAGILILFIFRGNRRGLIASLLGIVGWAVSLIAAFLLYPYAIKVIDDKTNIRDSITAHITEYVKRQLIAQKSGSDGSALPDSVLAVLNNSSNSTLDAQAVSAAEPLVSIFMDIVAFVIVLLIVRLIFKIVQSISMHFTGRNHGTVGVLNSMAGMFFGLVEGAILAYLLLLLLTYLSLFTDIMVLSNQLEDSVVAGVIGQLDLIPYAGHIDELIN